MNTRAPAKFCFGIYILFVVISSCVFASDVTDIGSGARAIGLGRAYNAVTADGYSLFANPAGLGGLDSFQIVSMYGEISGDVAYTMLGAVVPTKFGVFGVGYAGSKAGDIVVTTIEANGRVGSSTTFNYGNDLYLLSYANRFKDSLSYGLTLKSFRKGSSQVSGGEGTGMNADAGLTYDVNKKLRLGLLVKNLFAGSAGAIRWGNGYVEQLPLEFKTGVLVKPRDNLNFLFDLNTKSGYPTEAKAGLEWMVNSYLSLRVGMEQLSASNFVRYINYSGGVGIVFGNIGLDYAYYYDTVLPYNSRHFVSFKISADPSDKNEARQRSQIATPNIQNTLQPSVKKIYIADVPDFYWASNAVQYIVDKKILSLYPDGKFRPNKPVIRADLASVLIKVKYSAIPQDAPSIAFTDVDSKYWASATIRKAAGLDLMKGYGDGTFKPNGKVALLDGLLACIRISNLKPARPASLPYSNIAPDYFALGQINAGKDAGLLEFVTGSTLPTERPLTRAELAWMVYKLNLK